MRKNGIGFLSLSLLLLLTGCVNGGSSSWDSIAPLSSPSLSEDISLDGGSLLPQPSDTKQVTTTYGTLEGSLNNNVYEFLGVPYGEVRERFVKGSAPSSWTGVRSATRYGATSPQQGSDGDNNCLNLNLWTPSTRDNKKRAVMVWLHGGGFSSGDANSSSYDGEALARSQDVVVIGVNHRLNAFGFLDLSAYSDKYADSANVGIRDIELALDWIKANVSYFGGDPDNITLFGQSGGGAKVLALMSAPSAKGKFQKGIVQSRATETVGVVFNTKAESERIAQLTLANLNISQENIEEIQKVSVSSLLAATSSALARTATEFQIPAPLSSGYQMEFQPVVDGSYITSNPVLDEGFAEPGKDVSLLIGSNLNEWTTWYPNDVTVTAEITTAIRSAYPNENVTASHIDTLIRLPMLKIMSHKADQEGGKVYSYVFTKGSSYHGAEIPYVFDHSSDRLASAISEAWANFAKNGTPSPSLLPTWG